MLKNTISIFIMLLFLTLPKSVSAQVVINEILPNPVGSDDGNEWVELYNTSATPIDLTGYKLKDASDNEQVVSGSINPNGYVVVIAVGSFSINNDAETVRLFDTSAVLLDTFSYTNSTEGKSWGRYPDGGTISSFVLNPTSGTPNQAPNTPTPSPTVSPTQTAVSQTPTARPTGSPTSIPTKSPSPKPSLNPSSTPTDEPEETDSPNDNLSLSNIVVGEATPTGIVKGTSVTNKKPLIAIIFISSGVLFLGYGGYLLYNMNSKNNAKGDINIQNEDNKDS